MRDELLGYYERELSFLRQMGAEFARKYPKIASRLSLDEDKCEDPHVERMIEAFAFLAGRVRLKVDDEFPEVTESLLNVLYPHYLAPVPSMSIAQFSLDPGLGKVTSGYKVESGSVLYSRPIQGTPCRFRTCYPVVLWPIEVVSAKLESPMPADSKGRWAEAFLRISLRCLGDTELPELTLVDENVLKPIDRIRFFLSGEPQLSYKLYELIFNNASSVEIRPGRAKRTGPGTGQKPGPIRLPVSSLKAVGFEPDEGMLPYSARSFTGYRLLTEYFAFPDKFLFFDVTGVSNAARAGFGTDFEIVIAMKNVTPPSATVDESAFQLGCTPVVNLFSKLAEPIQLTQQQHEYQVVPDVHRQMATEVYSIDAVRAVDPSRGESREFRPFYSYSHSDRNDPGESLWYATRRQSQRKDDPG
ncbi:MAG: type VI secretion system baseplate subunit TssF, partial [Blastocatellia bacterium]